MNTSHTSKQTARILIIEDDVSYSALCARYLAKESRYTHEVFTCSTATDAIEMCVDRDFDCLITDYKLPDSTGTKLITTLQETLGVSMPPTIVLTAEGGVGAAAEAVRANASDFLPKENVTVASLCRAVRNAIEKGRLNREVVESNEKLNLAYQQLQHNAKEIENFYHTVSHEVKTPLTAIQEFISLVKDEIMGPITSQQKELLGYSLESCEQIATHFNDLLDLARMGSGKLKLNKEWDSPTRLIKRSMRGVECAAETQGVKLITKSDGISHSIYVDVNRIVQVLSNLLTNAIKHSDPGSSIIVEQGLSTDNCFEIKIIDFGCGIEPDEQERIFNRLYQINSKEDCAMNGGLGLGLSIARDIMHLHDGKLQIESCLGEGSTFTAQLPMGIG